MRALTRLVTAMVGVFGLALGLPAQASVTPYGVSCGPVLVGDIATQHNPQVLTLQLTHGTPHADALMVFGVHPLVTPLPAGQCLLLTDAYHLEYFVLNGAGNAMWHFVLPPGFHGEARLQMLEFHFGTREGLTFLSSNGVYVVVPPV